MKALVANDELFLTDAKGKRTGVVLDLRTYENLRRAAEELADIQAYDSSRTKVRAEIEAGEFSTLAGFRNGRGRKPK